MARRRQRSALRPTTTFETFPFAKGLTPNILAADYASELRAQRIAGAAKAVDDRRRAWLNPPDLIDIVPEATPTAAPGEAPRRYPERILPKSGEAAAKLRERTLTNLYNQRPRSVALIRRPPLLHIPATPSALPSIRRPLMSRAAASQKTKKTQTLSPSPTPPPGGPAQTRTSRTPVFRDGGHAASSG